MSDENDDESSKTEEPSQRKLDEARKKGQTVSSREINHFFMMLALAAFMMLLAGPMGRQATTLLTPFITQPETFSLDSNGLRKVLTHVMEGTLILLLLPTLITIIAAFAPAVVQRKWVFSAEQMKPKLSKISPLAGFKRLLGWRAIIEFIRNLLKISLIAIAAFYAIWPYRDLVVESIRVGNFETLSLSQWLAGRILVATCVILFLLSLADYVYQRFIFLKGLRMTKQEVKDEYKQQEGDPHIKGKIRQLRRERAKRRMMASVPKADVVITNPTHYAVALQYDSAKMPAPVLLAKGTDDVALRIREVAEKHKIPIMRNPPLARVLYATTEIDDEIPVEHYQAVAKIIGYVYKLKGKAPKKPATNAAPPTLKLRK